MPEIIKMLGVEPQEEFNIVTAKENGMKKQIIHNPYRFNWKGLVNCNNVVAPNIVLINLLNGDYKIEKLSLKPQNGQLCCFIDGGGEILSERFNVSCSGHLALLKMGNCFTTEEEAEKHREEMLEKLKKIRKEMVEQ